MVTRPGRLYRTLKPTSALFRFKRERDQTYGAWTDEAIHSISTTRGGGDVWGITPATATVEVAGDVNAARDYTASLQLTPYGAGRISALTGIPAASITHRYTGRVASQEATDWTPTRRKTTITAAAWASQLPGISAFNTPMYASNPALSVLYSKSFDTANLPGVTLIGGSSTDAIYFPSGENYRTVTMADLAGKYAAEAGVLLRTRRDGSVQTLTAIERDALAQTWRDRQPVPLHRSQCVSPARWVQPVTSPGIVTWKTWDTTKSPPTEVTRQYGITYGDGARPTRDSPRDLTHIMPRGDNLSRVQWGAAHRVAAVDYVVPEVTIDLLALIRRGHEGDLAFVGRLLTLESGDWLSLSWDWPGEVSGIYSAEQITERIDQDTWQMTLGLLPHRQVTGATQGEVDRSGTTWATRYPPATTWADSPHTWATV